MRWRHFPGGGYREVEEVAGGWSQAGRPVTRAGTAGRVALGAMTRTGSVTLIALCGTRRWPVFAGRWEAPLMPGDLPGQPYHAAAELAAAAAESMIRKGEAAAEEAALAALRSAAADLPATATITGVAVVVKAVSVPGSVAAVLRSHAWMHAAEGVLYPGRGAGRGAARRLDGARRGRYGPAVGRGGHHGPGRRRGPAVAPGREGCRPCRPDPAV